MSDLNPTIRRVTERVIEKSRSSRQSYLDLMDREADRKTDRGSMSCSVLAHAYAGAEEDQEEDTDLDGLLGQSGRRRQDEGQRRGAHRQAAHAPWPGCLTGREAGADVADREPDQKGRRHDRQSLFRARHHP